MTRPYLWIALLATLALAAPAQPQARRAPNANDAMQVDRAMQATIVDSVTTALLDQYIFADVAERMATTVRENLKRGEYDDDTTLAAFTRALSEDLVGVSNDRHLRVRTMPPDEVERIQTAWAMPEDERQAQQKLWYEETRAKAAKDNFGFRETKILPGNVGYVRLDGFNDAALGGPTAIAAINFVAHCDAIIFDVRQNGGGSPSMIQLLMGYFFDEPTHLNSFYIRKTDETKQFWTAAHVEGPRLADTPVYVLTSNRTFSAAEEFSYNFRCLERGTLVGETTGGGAHPVEGHVFPDLAVGMTVPFGRAVNPITGTNWEGVGVEPHIAVPAAQALDAAHAHALEKLLAAAASPERRAQLEWELSGLRARLEPIALDPAVLAAYAGTYEDRVITFADGALHYRRGDRAPMVMRAMSATVFRFDEMDGFRLEVVLDESGGPTQLIGHYGDGRQDRSQRTDGEAARHDG